MASNTPEPDAQIWTCVNEVCTPDMRREDFFSALDVWISRPQVASTRFLGSIYLSVETREDVYLLASGYERGELEIFVERYWGSVGILCRRLLPKLKHYKAIEEFVLIGKLIEFLIIYN